MHAAREHAVAVGRRGGDLVDIWTILRLMERPAPFEPIGPLIWQDEHVSRQLLVAHLDPNTDATSRRPETIDRSVAWIIDTLQLKPGMAVLIRLTERRKQHCPRPTKEASMYTARLMATAFLWNGSDVLLIRRSVSRTFHPGLWAGVGGHIEPHEISTPDSACLREIAEETGITSKDLAELSLRYILLRQRATEIRQQYVYFGVSRTRRVRTTSEGELHWVPETELFDRELVPTTRLLLEHYMRNRSAEPDVIWVGVLDGADPRSPAVSWSRLRDWE